LITDNTYPKAIINTARVARLATADLEYKPHLVPVVFVYDNNRDFYFIPIDKKTKRSRPENLKRVSNIKENPNDALLIDEYNEDWTKLYFIIIQGKASIIGYIQYVILINVEKLHYHDVRERVYMEFQENILYHPSIIDPNDSLIFVLYNENVFKVDSVLTTIDSFDGVKNADVYILTEWQYYDDWITREIDERLLTKSSLSRKSIKVADAFKI
jgi:PPOX class probable F420-dependent enzyme